MKIPLVVLTGIACLGAMVTDNTTHANDKLNKDFSQFVEIKTSANSNDWDKTAPWKLPEGYSQSIVSDESDLNIYNLGRDDRHDMNTVNETGDQAGRFLYRTHETSFPGSLPEGGSVSVVDLTNGETKILIQGRSYNALDGIRWSPWGSLVFAEETTNGRFFELILTQDLKQAESVHDRPAVGRMTHEGIEIDAQGNVYVVDEYRGQTSACKDAKGHTYKPCGGGIYKFVPDKYADLSSGSLYVLGIMNNGSPDNTGQGQWLGPIDPADARQSGTAAGGASYQRPEDLEIINGVLYVAITEGPRDEDNNELYEGRVLSIDLASMVVANFVMPGINAPVEIGKPGEEGHKTGFDGVDNLAEAPNGDLVMIEDNKPSDIWFASTSSKYESGASKAVRLFASLSDPGAEGTGIYFSPTDPGTLFVNIQHSSATNGDGTWAITKQGDN